MVNEVSAIDNLRLENQLTELTSLVRQLAVGQHQPSITARVCGICTSVEHPTDMFPTLVRYMIVNNLEGNSTGQVRFKGNIQLKSSDLPKLSSEYEIPSTAIPTATTTESAIIGQLTILGGPDEAVGNKQPGVLA
ncbi:hypothetical protein CR513_13398, partial [Mucuna pruriens]